MKKISYLIFSFVLIILVNACAGYEPIFGSKNLQFSIKDYLIEGDKTLGKNIYSKLYKLSDTSKNNENIKNVDLVIKV